ncbi:26.5 kDa heat shock protein, mitochondrial [Morus notabilis]|uniref:26.5 kDa heat shock protein, mitochondrial n=1 Tax=Morus notabilis TaxID=981085 RepID=UPI000CED759E|nr:26.5 kDa heat shock protein, mitochondrial [Morus notabilis]
MALARLALRNSLHQRVLSPPSPAAASWLLSHGAAVSGGTEVETKRFMSTEGTDKVAGETSEGKEVAASEDQGKKSRSLFRRKPRNRGLWRRSHDREFIPTEIFEFCPSGLGNALIQATENVNRLFEKLNLSPWSLSGRVKEVEDHYKLRFDVPGLSKEDLKITVHDGILTINGEHKEEDGGEGSDDESRMYKYYYTSLVLPEDAKADEVKAELKHGVLNITIPRTEKPKKDVKEVQIH